MPLSFGVICYIFLDDMQPFLPPSFFYHLPFLQKKKNLKIHSIWWTLKSKDYFFKSINNEYFNREVLWKCVTEKDSLFFVTAKLYEEKKLNSGQFHQPHPRPKAIFIRGKNVFHFLKCGNMCTQVSTKLKVKSCDTAGRITWSLSEC